MDNGDLLSLLGSLITAYVALNIFGKWTSQKGSEVVAIEAKEVFSLIEKIQRLKLEIQFLPSVFEKRDYELLWNQNHDHSEGDKIL